MIAVDEAGFRERLAFIWWWSSVTARMVADPAEHTKRIERGERVPSLFESLRSATYDQATDSITWNGETLSIETINKLYVET